MFVMVSSLQALPFFLILFSFLPLQITSFPCVEDTWMCSICEACIALLAQPWDSNGGISILGHVQNMSGQGPEQLDPALEC